MPKHIVEMQLRGTKKLQWLYASALLNGKIIIVSIFIYNTSFPAVYILWLCPFQQTNISFFDNLFLR